MVHRTGHPKCEKQNIQAADELQAGMVNEEE